MPDTPSSTVEVEEIRPCPDGTFNVVFKGAGCDLNFNVDAIIAMGLLPPCDGHIHIVEWIDGTINAVHCPGLYDGLMSCAVEVELPGKTWKDFNFPTLSDFTGHLGMDRSRIGPIGPGVDGSWSWKTRPMRDTVNVQAVDGGGLPSDVPLPPLTEEQVQEVALDMHLVFEKWAIAPADAATIWACFGRPTGPPIRDPYIDEPGVRETMPLPPNDETAADRLYGYCHHVVEQLCLAEMEVRHVDLDDYTLLNFSRKLNSAILLVKAVGRYLRPDSNTCAIDVGVLEGTEEMVARDAADDANEIIRCLAQLKPGDMMIEHLIGRARYWLGGEQPVGDSQRYDVRPEPSRTVAFEDLYRYAPIVRRADTLYHAVQWFSDDDSKSATRFQQVKTFVDEHSACDFSIHHQTTTDRLIIRRHDRSVPIVMEMGEWLIAEVETSQLTVVTPAEYNARYCEAP